MVVSCKGSEETDVFGVDLDGGGYQVGELYDEVLFPFPPDGEEAPLVVVEYAAYYAHGLAVHGFCQFTGLVEDGRLGMAYGEYEPVHLLGADGHRLVDRPAALVAVLKRREPVDIRVERGLCLMDEEQVLDQGDIPALEAPSDFHDHLRHGGEHLQAGIREVVYREIVGVPALEITHHEPLFSGGIHKGGL